MGVTRAVRYETADPTARLTENEAELLSLLTLVRSERKDLSGLERESVSRVFTAAEDGILLMGEYVGVENIAVQQEIYVDNPS